MPYTVNAEAVWRGDRKECAALYSQYVKAFHRDFPAMRAHYGWTRRAMLTALKSGR